MNHRWVFAIDPGGTCGFAWTDLNAWNPDRFPDRELKNVILPGQMAPSQLIGWISTTWTYPEVRFVLERFTIGQQTAKKTQTGALDALEVIGWVKYAALLKGSGFSLQTPAEAKRFVPDGQLKELGLWVPGKDHARDAVRHLIYAVVHGENSSLREYLVGKMAG